jgi:tetratricopeptide (TPR) repeat protein
MAHLRLAIRLRLAPPDARGDAADESVIAARAITEGDVWLMRRVATAAQARAETVTAAETEAAIARSLAGAIERGSYALRAAASLERSQAGIPTAPARGAELLAPFAAAAPTHGPLLEALADLHDRAGAHAAAVDALEAAANASAVPARKLALYHRAAVLAADRADDEERALAMLEQAAAIDVAYRDVFDRSRTILERKGDRAKLSDLVRRRAAAGGEGAMLVDLHLAEASLREADHDVEAAKEALRAALALAPERVEALRKLAQLCLTSGDHRTAADALIRIARVRKDREELRWVFFTLGDIYDAHIPDPKRAEAAFLRVLKLDSEDLPSMERLAAIYQREQQLPQAADMLDRLAKAEVDPDRVRKHQLALAGVLEASGDARKAEQVLEIARRAGPTELETLRALAEFYTRQRAQTAHAMHLNRAVADFRHALVTDLGDTQAWLGLVEVLGWRGKRDAARAVASVATALGVVDVELSKLLDPSGGAPGAGLRGADGDLDDALAPQALTPSTRSVFRLLGGALEKVVPFDPRSLRAEKLGGKDTALRPIALEIGKWMGVSDVEIWLAPTGRVCMPVSSQPVTLVVGRDLLTADERERVFLLARALRVARSQLTLALRSQPAELAALLAGLVLNFDPNYQLPVGVDHAAAQDFMKRIARQLPRRAQEEIGPHVFEMAGAIEYEPAKLPLAVSELADRAALLMTGNAPAALAALAKLAGEPLGADARARVAAVRRSPESASLVSFALSDAHFEARSRAGLS